MELGGSELKVLHLLPKGLRKSPTLLCSMAVASAAQGLPFPQSNQGQASSISQVLSKGSDLFLFSSFKKHSDILLTLPFFLVAFNRYFSASCLSLLLKFSLPVFLSMYGLMAIWIVSGVTMVRPLKESSDCVFLLSFFFFFWLALPVLLLSLPLLFLIVYLVWVAVGVLFW